MTPPAGVVLWDGLGPAGAGLALAAAAALALLAVWLRPLSRRVVVAFGDLWLRARAASGFAVPWREALALALFAAALASVAGGIAGPRLAARPPRRIAVVLDASASMDARDREGRRRLDVAKLLAARVARAAAARDEVAILRVSAGARTVAPWELAAVEADDAPADFGAAASTAAAFLERGAKGRRDADVERRVVVLSDRAAAFPDVPGAAVDRVPVGAPAENLAIASLGVSPGDASQGGLTAQVTVANLGGSEAAAEIVLHTEHFRVGSARVVVAPGATEALAFHLDGLPRGGTGPEDALWASLDGITFASGGADALARDDRRAAFAPEGAALRVALLTGGNRFLEGALAALGGLHVTKGEAALAAADVVVADAGVSLPTLPAGVRGVLRFGAPGVRKVNAPVLADWNGDHPATRRISMDDLTMASADVLAARAGDVVLAAVEEGPVALAREAAGRREVLVGFDPARSDFPLRLGFPVFVGGAVRWLGGESSGEIPERGVAGQAVRIGGADPSARILRAALAPWESGRDPGEARLVEQGGETVLAALRAGLYEVESSGRRVRVEVGVDGGESSLAVEGLTGAPAEVPAWAAAGRSADPERELAPLLFAAGALLLALKAVVA